MIVEGPKRFEDVITQTLGEFPGFTLIPLNSGEQVEIVDTSRQIEIEKRWSDEIVALTSSVGRVQQGVDQLMPSTIKGFASLYKACVKNMDRILGKSGEEVDIEMFVRDSLGLFYETVDFFTGLEKSPVFFSTGKNGKQAARYKKSQYVHMTPRDMRNIIGLYGLDGEDGRSAEELAEIEQITANTVLMSAQKLSSEIAVRHF